MMRRCLRGIMHILTSTFSLPLRASMMHMQDDSELRGRVQTLSIVSGRIDLWMTSCLCSLNPGCLLERLGINPYARKWHGYSKLCPDCRLQLLQQEMLDMNSLTNNDAPNTGLSNSVLGSPSYLLYCQSLP